MTEQSVSKHAMACKSVSIHFERTFSNQIVPMDGTV